MLFIIYDNTIIFTTTNTTKTIISDSAYFAYVTSTATSTDPSTDTAFATATITMNYITDAINIM